MPRSGCSALHGVIPNLKQKKTKKNKKSVFGKAETGVPNLDGQ